MTTHCPAATFTAGNTTCPASYLVTEHPSLTPFFMCDYSVTTHRHSSTSFIRHCCHCSSLPRKSSSTHHTTSYTSPTNHQPPHQRVTATSTSSTSSPQPPLISTHAGLPHQLTVEKCLLEGSLATTDTTPSVQAIITTHLTSQLHFPSPTLSTINS